MTTERDRVKSARQFKATDADGRLTVRFDPQGSATLEAADRTGPNASVWLDDAGRFVNWSVPPGTLKVRMSWNGVGSGGVAYLAAPEDVVRVYQKDPEQLTAPAVRKFVMDQIEAAKHRGQTDYDSLASLGGAFESLELTAEFAALIKVRPGLQSGVLSALNEAARRLCDIHEFEAQKDFDVPLTRLSARDATLHRAICAWVGVAPGPSVRATTPEVTAKIKQVADEIIAAARPYVGDESSSANIVDALGPLGSPAYRFFPEAFATAHPRGRRIMLHALESRFKRLEDVEWALASDDPDVVVAGYGGLRERLDPAQARLAVERLERINRPGISARASMQIGYLLPAFRERAAE